VQEVAAFIFMGKSVLLFGVGVGDFGIGEDLQFADDVRIISLVDHGESAFAQLLFQHVLFLADADCLPFQLHPKNI
jgi:hypothetical protein